MQIIRARNINGAWREAKCLLSANHTVRPSRVGEVWECKEPVTTLYERPCERVLFDPVRNANHIFHFMEALHMLAGRQDVAWLERFNSKIRDFIGKEELQHDAYGHRWRKAFDMDGGAEDDYADQLLKIVRMLKKDPNERRAVLTMWNPLWDLERPELPSVPCNLVITFKIRNGALAMIVFCRSNDVIFGAYGANVVHMSMLQEYMAAMIGVPVGPYWQVSDSWHAYTSRWVEFGGNDLTAEPWDYYSGDSFRGFATVQPYPMVAVPETFDLELERWMARECDLPYDNPFFLEVAEPLWKSWEAYKGGDLAKALVLADLCEASDWRLAAVQWLSRIQEKRAAKAARS